MLVNPYPADHRFSKASANDNRFENLYINLEAIGGRDKAIMMTNMKMSTSRKDLFSHKDVLPDSNVYQTQNYNQSLNLLDSNKSNKALKFDKRPLRYFHAPQKQFDVPDAYDHDKLMQGYDKSSKVKKVKGHVEFRN